MCTINDYLPIGAIKCDSHQEATQMLTMEKNNNLLYPYTKIPTQSTLIYKNDLKLIDRLPIYYYYKDCLTIGTMIKYSTFYDKIALLKSI